MTVKGAPKLTSADYPTPHMSSSISQSHSKVTLRSCFVKGAQNAFIEMILDSGVVELRDASSGGQAVQVFANCGWSSCSCGELVSLDQEESQKAQIKMI